MTRSPSSGNRGFLGSRAFKTTLVVLAVVLVLWVATELAGPPIAEGIVRGMIEDRYPQVTDPYVSISAFPALKLAFKKYDRLTVDVDTITLQGVSFDRVELNSDEWPFGRFKGVIRADEIERFFSLKHSYVVDPQLVIEGDQLSVTGRVQVGGMMVSVSAGGILEPVDGSTVFFQPRDIRAAGIPLAQRTVDQVQLVMQQNPVFAVREDLPYTISRISIERGKMVITGNVDMEKALNISL